MGHEQHLLFISQCVRDEYWLYYSGGYHIHKCFENTPQVAVSGQNKTTISIMSRDREITSQKKLQMR